ncbi:hypothetical protein H2199_008698 [Coniosporium tulheliwenetii]|uniref:Uncharacterized protein n=1 Tax=Coniosporium tulheliwenetii TaxID=3383036 RepID=A0ACC2YIM2_9PEZI|nr:hypothetical protein H2199_008698 [Cladosporium sp. JES 115]
MLVDLLASPPRRHQAQRHYRQNGQVGERYHFRSVEQLRSRSHGGMTRLQRRLCLERNFLVSKRELQGEKRKSTEDEAQKNFLEHSFALHEDLKSSQIVGEPIDETTADLDTAGVTLTSFLTSASSLAETSFVSNISASGIDEHDKSHVTFQQISFPARITNLKDLPKADHILHIAPQTITANLVVGIIRISPARTVRTKRGRGREMDIVELLVGDDTYTPFSITFWLVPDGGQRPTDKRDQSIQNREPLREALDRLRIQDVVLLQSVALHAFQGKVHGQSLSHRITRNETRVNLLVRGGEEVVDVGKVEKVQRVVEWVGQFVAPAARPVKAPSVKAQGADDRRRVRYIEELPPDTQ